MDDKKFPVGIETFQKLREQGFVYVDKTELIHRLITNGQYYFLSRPRRFGKSLLLSTIQAYFEGKRELFEGLAIERYGHDWAPHPIFHLNLVGFSGDSVEGLESTLEVQFQEWEKTYGLQPEGFRFAERFSRLIRTAVEKTGRQAVILIDEYDKPLVANLDDTEAHDRFRDILKPVYSNIKGQDRYIRFALITGVSRFSRMSIFSDINNLFDITLTDDYNSICGITEREMLACCRHGIERIAERNGWSFGETVAQLKRNYDGYRFSKNGEDIYNPYSLLSAFAEGEIGSYWYATGTPTFLTDRIRKDGFRLWNLNREKLDASSMSSSDSYLKTPVALLYQTGYLTISGYNPRFGTYTLRIPNREVEMGLFKNLLPAYAGKSVDGGFMEITDFVLDVEAGDAEGFLTRLKSFLADIPYELSKNRPEVYFENNLYIIFKLMGFYIDAEYRTSDGRIDLLLKTDGYIYVMELKLNGTARDAIEQIDAKGYTLPFRTDGRKLFKIGISFSQATRNIDGWIIE